MSTPGTRCDDAPTSPRSSPARARRLARAFFDRDALELAPLLLNKLLVHRAGGVQLAARVVEVEAYRGSADPGSHAYRGPTPRTATMFGPPGHLYVYFTYGMHWCANVVAGHARDDAGAVLLRAAAPVEGIAVMQARRPKAQRVRDLCAGPARLCQAFGVTGEHDGTDLTGERLWIADDGALPPPRPFVSPRIGLARGKGDAQPWRFCVPGDPHVSRAPRGAVKTRRAAVGHG